MRLDTRQDWDWADSHMLAVVSILESCFDPETTVRVATPHQDQKRATDLVLSTGETVALRLRRSAYLDRDITIRVWRQGKKTEWHKLKEGYVSHYLYGWIDNKDMLSEWMLVSVSALIASGLLDRPIHPVKYNKDKKTGFIWNTHQELSEAGCILKKNIKGQS